MLQKPKELAKRAGAKTTDLAKRATARTAKAGRNSKKFVSDGCSGVPDWNIFECCEDHDHDYEAGIGRKKADNRFHTCISCRIGRPILAAVYYVGVRIFGWHAYYVARHRGWWKS